MSTESAEGLPSDEAEVLEKGEAFAFEGGFEWEKMGEAVGVEVSWAQGSVKGGEKEKAEGAGKGLDGVWEWVEGL